MVLRMAEAFALYDPSTYPGLYSQSPIKLQVSVALYTNRDTFVITI